MIIKARAKPIQIEAIQVRSSNIRAVLGFIRDSKNLIKYEIQETSDGPLFFRFEIETFHIKLTIRLGDYIIRNSGGEISVCSSEHFKEYYDDLSGEEELKK